MNPIIYLDLVFDYKLMNFLPIQTMNNSHLITRLMDNLESTRKKIKIPLLISTTDITC
jgi:hypothetical protein